MSEAPEYQLPPANPDTVAHFKRQWLQVLAGAGKVTCECERTLPLPYLFRCLYCGCFFCQACAEVHFGKTRKQYAEERATEIAAERKAVLDAKWNSPEASAALLAEYPQESGQV